MALKDTKGDVFGLISASRTLLENYPKFSEINSFLSINNSTDQIEFVVDLFKALGTTEDLMGTIADIIINQLDAIELAVKSALKRLIVEYISCNINPSIYNELSNDGINIKVSSFDIFNILKNSPLGRNGDLYYFDIKDEDNLYKSKDLNTFLWYVINVVGEHPWGVEQEVSEQEIVKFKFEEEGDNIYNFINIKISNNYIDKEDIKLNEFNSDFIDSVKLFDKKALIGELFGRIFGSFSITRTREEIMMESEIEEILDRITQCGGDDLEFEDDFFSFSNTEYNNMLLKAEKKQMGEFIYSDIKISITSDDIADALRGFDNNATLVEQRDVFIAAINNIVDKAVDNPENELSTKDKYNFKASLLRNLIKELTSLITMTVMSPKMYLVILLNLKLINISIEYNNPKDFIKNNLNIITDIATSIKDEVLDYLVKEIMRLGGVLALEMLESILKHRMIVHRKYIASLTGFKNLIE